MRCLIRSAAILSVLVAALGTAGADDKNNAKQNTTTTYVNFNELDGVTLANSPGEKGSNISLKLDQKLLANASMLGSALELNNPQGKRLQMKDLPKDVSLDLTSDVVVRRIHLPPKKDEKGHTIPYTEKELKDLRGDSKLKGYNAELSDLHLVKVKGAKGDEAKKVYVNRIFIQSEPQNPPPSNNNPNKKP